MRFPSVLLFCGLLAAAAPLYAQETPSTAPATQTSTGQTTPAQTNPGQTTTTPPAAAPPLQFQSLPPEPHTLTPEEQQKLQQQRVLAAASRLARNEAAWGPAISSPGYSLTMTEAGRQTTPEGTEVTYTLTAKGYAEGDSLKLLHWPLDQNVQEVADGLTVDGMGQVICPAITKGNCLQTLPAGVVKFKTKVGSAEPVRLALTDADNKAAAAFAIPFPVKATDKGCTLELMLGVKSAALALIQGRGFPPSTTINLDSKTYNDDHPIKATTKANGDLIVAILPSAPDHDAGQMTVTYSSTTCSPTLTFPWGTGSYRQQ